jgi:hypothetical protein
MNPRDAASWFVQQLRRQINDRAIESAGKNIDLYFDASYVRDAAVGVQAFYAPPHYSFDHETFKSPRTLIQCLFSGGWLGPVRMLAPHQSEFLSLLQYGFGVGPPEEFKRREQELIDTFEWANDPTRDAKWAFTQISSHALAQTVFKIVETTQSYWKTRLEDWYERDILSPSTLELSQAQVVVSPYFNRLRVALDELRPRVKMSNFADAAALAALAMTVERFAAGEADRLPLVYASRLFFHAVERAGLADAMLYEAADGNSYSALCDSDYFVFRATFFPSVKAFASEAEQARSANLLRVEDIRSSLFDVVREGDADPEEMLARMMIDGRQLAQEVRELENFSFFSSVWLQTAKKEVSESLKEMVERLRSHKLEDRVTTHLSSLHRALAQRAREYREIRNLWQAITSAEKLIREQFPPPGAHSDPFAVSGLVRFSFPPKAEQLIRKVIPALVQGEQQAQVDATKMIFDTLKNTDRADVNALARAAALLWTAELYEEITRLLRPHRLFHHSLAIIFGAAAAERKKTRSDAVEVVTELDVEYKSEKTDPQKRTELAIGLAYICYHLAILDGFLPSWVPVRPANVSGSEWVDRAVEYARHAAADLPFGDLKSAYALNQVLYYSVAQGTADPKKLRPDAIRFSQYRRQNEIWQFRFDDTFAKYSYYLSKCIEDADEKKKQFDNAKRYSTSAFESSNSNPDVISFYMQLQAEESAPAT